jgi:hypothetical protein
MIESLRASRYQMVKVWYLCDYLWGDPSNTAGAEREGIIEAGWYGDDELAGETVFPDIIKTTGIALLGDLHTGIIDPGVRFADF